MSYIHLDGDDFVSHAYSASEIKKRNMQNNKDEGKKQAQISSWKNLYVQMYKYDPSLLSDQYAEKMKMLYKMKDVYKAKKESNNKNVIKNCYAITINPMYERIPFHEFEDNVTKFFNRSFITDYEYVYEVGDTKDNFHVHGIIYVERCTGYAKVIKNISSTFKHQCDLMIKSSVTVKPVFDLENWTSYISKSSERSKQFRTLKNLSNIYTKFTKQDLK